MSSGTPKFQGKRLKEGREARSLTAVALAELIGKTPQAISKYEQNDTSPQPLVLEAIAQALNMPLPFFTRPPRTECTDTVFYRSMSAVTKRARTRAHWKLEWLKEITAYLSEFVAFPSPNLPKIGLPTDPLLISDDDIENAATDARHYWRMSDSPIGNMVTLLENQGVVIARHQLGAESLDSLSTFDTIDERSYIMVGTDKGSAVRWRFDVAHELGHLLLHANLDTRELATPEYFKRIEEQAHRFARAFLLPMEPFGEDFFATDLEVLRAIKPKWKVSIAAMIMRGRDAKILLEETEKRLWVNLSRRGWRREEPFDQEIQAEEPRLLRRAIELVLKSGEQTADDLVTSLQLELSDIEGLVGLPSGYLKGDFAPVQLIRRQAPSKANSNGPPGEIIPIRKQETDQNA